MKNPIIGAKVRFQPMYSDEHIIENQLQFR